MIYGSLEKAFLECLSSDPSTALGQARIYYNTTLNKARLYDGTQWRSIGGVGGSSISFVSPDGIGAQELQENGIKCFYFPQGGSVKIIAFVKVPSEYSPGGQIKLKLTQFSPSASGTQLIKSTTYLIKKDTDSIFSQTNSHISTNTLLTNSVANQSRENILDLTSSDGKCNSVSVSPGDELVVHITRDTDTDTEDVRVCKDGSEPIFG